MSVSVIIPVYATNEDLVKMTDACLYSIFLSTPPGTEVIVVDDGSPVSYDPDVGRLITMPVNGGYSKAVNEGLKKAKGDILIVGNNDLIFKKGWLDALCVILENYDIATCWTSDQKVNLRTTVEVERDAKFGSLFAMRRKVYETLGGFDEQFRGYFADLDYRERAMNARFTIGKNLAFVVDHKAKATYAQTDPNDDEYYRAMRLFEAKWGYLE